MGYGLTLKEGMADGVKRVAREQLGRARDVLQDANVGAAEQVHEARKALKRLRAVLRLVRPALGDEGIALNDLARDLGRELSGFRDQDVIAATFERMTDQEHAFQEMRSVLANRRAQLSRADASSDEHIEAARQSVVRGLELLDVRLAALSLSVKPGFIARAVHKAHARTANAMRLAVEDPTAEHLHEWRKQAKHYGYVARLLGKIWPTLGGGELEHLEAVGECLGLERDLGLLATALTEAVPQWHEPRVAAALLALVRQERERLMAEAFAVGKKIAKAEPKAVKRRIAATWPAHHATSKAAEAKVETEPKSPPPPGRRRTRRASSVRLIGATSGR